MTILYAQDGTVISSSNPLPVTLYGPNGDPIGHAEDTAHASGDRGVMSLAVRKNTDAALANADGDYIPLIANATGRLWTAGSLVDPGGAAVTNRLFYADSDAIVEAAIYAVPVIAAATHYNGTTGERTRGVTPPATLLASAARTTTTLSPDITNFNGRGAYIYLIVTAHPGGGETLSLEVDDKSGGGYGGSVVQFGVVATATTGTFVGLVYPGAVETVAVSRLFVQAIPFPRIGRVAVVHSASGSWTYSLLYSLLP